MARQCLTEVIIKQTYTYVNWLVVLLSTVAYLALAYVVPRSSFGALIGLMTALFLGYGWLVTRRNRTAISSKPDRLLFTLAIGFRLLFLTAIPVLSDDVYRFIWDGRLLAHGFDPYLYLPTQILNTHIATTAGLDQTLFRSLNSPNYFTVYPPQNQALFGLAAWLAGQSLLWNIVWLRVPIILSETGTLWVMTTLLKRQRLNPNLALLYGLNPLVIVELTGNVHFEAIMIFFVLLASWWLLQSRVWLSAGSLALGISAKLLPVLLLPLIIRRLGWLRGLAYVALTGGLTLLLFAPFASVEPIRNVGASLSLYFQKFEFNASVYYVLRTIGYWLTGYNTIGLVGRGLSAITTLGIFWIAFRWRHVPVSTQFLATLTLYFALATTVHPWYITSLVAASVFTRFRYPLVWSALIPLSYYTYRAQPYHENLWLTAAEYTAVFLIMLVELWPYVARRQVF